MEFMLFFPDAPGDEGFYKRCSLKLDFMPSVGTTIVVKRSDNDSIPQGSYMVKHIEIDVEIVNKTIAKSGGRYDTTLHMERIGDW